MRARVYTKWQQQAVEEYVRRGLVPDPHTDERALCAADVRYWIDTYCETFDPRRPPSERVVPFKLYPRQRELLYWLEARELQGQRTRRGRGAVLKSRGVGVSWTLVCFCLHRWTFTPTFVCGFGSRKKEYVDGLGDFKSLLHKARWLLQRFAEDPARRWLLPDGWRPDCARICRITNPQNGSMLTGEGGDDIGRGDRTSIYVVDEAAHLEHPDLAEASLSATTDCRIDVGTFNGADKPFHQIVTGGKVPLFTYHWREHPPYTEEWAEGKREEVGPRVWAREYDLDFSDEESDLCVPARWAQACARPLCWQDGTAYDPGGPIAAGWDVADSEAGAENVLVLRRGAKVLALHAWHGKVEAAAWKAVALAEDAGAEYLHYDAQGPGTSVAETLAQGRPLRVRVNPVNGGAPASGRVWPDGRRASELFSNTRAELWCGELRERARKTFEGSYPPDECLWLPDDAVLLTQLSAPKVIATNAGRAAVEGKLQMRVRGVISPDRADALALSFAVPPPLLMPAPEEAPLVVTTL